MKQVVVVDYNPQWANHFEVLKNRLWPAVSRLSSGIEHVGSTSVVGLAAKPIIDIDIVIQNKDVLPEVIRQLQALGYEHRGDLGIEGREAFKNSTADIQHNLYVCLYDCAAYRNHMILRDHLRANKDDLEKYANLKRELAKKYSQSIDEYIEGKTSFILKVLNQYGMKSNDLDSIRAANESKK